MTVHQQLSGLRTYVQRFRLEEVLKSLDMSKVEKEKKLFVDKKCLKLYFLILRKITVL